MVKLIIFDLDGVLVDAKDIHYRALNKALGEEYAIEWNEHISFYDGLSTHQKLKKLTLFKKLPIERHKQIWEDKQKYTLKALSTLNPNYTLQNTIRALSERYKIAICSNSIRRTIFTVLTKLGIGEYVDIVISNEDVKNSKPHPEMYWKAMSTLSILAEETLIIEDSPQGLLASHRSGAHVLRVNNPYEVTYGNIDDRIQEVNLGQDLTHPKWVDKKLTIVIPMAGSGSRFVQAGYDLPKPLIGIKGKPMIQWVIENLNIDANYIYIVQKEHKKTYNLDDFLNSLTPNCKIIEVEGKTEGAACTVLLAKEFIDSNNPLFIVNSDQFVEWNSTEFMYKINESRADGGIAVFKATDPKWSFAKINNKGYIVEVAEKDPISDIATVGFYYWKKGSDFIKYAEQMISKDIRTNGEFYVCPVFNEAIQDNKLIYPVKVNQMFSLGTPEDLHIFINTFK